MRTSPIVAGRIERDVDGLPRSPDFGDLYHPRQGALAQARHVFLGGSELPARWSGRERFVILETGFGLGNNFLAAWHAWRGDPECCDRLHFISIEARPLERRDLAAVARDDALAPLARQLTENWPSLTCNLHRLSFEAGRVQLLLAFGDVRDWLPQIVAGVDAFFLDGFAPARNPQMWEPRLFKAMARLAAPGATAATWSVARSVRDGLAAAGFEVRIQPGTGGKREITTARFAPRFVPRPSPRRAASASFPAPGIADGDRMPIAIVGGGLAGCAAARALAGQGRSSILFERHAEFAREGSGNAAGIYHGIVHRHDGHHARFHRAAAFEAQRAVAAAIAGHGVRGSAAGLLRLEPSGAGLARMRDAIDGLGLPADYVRAVSTEEASALAGLVVTAPAWHFPGGGWVEPRGLARAFVEIAGERVAIRCETEVAAIRRIGEQWHLLDAAGGLLAVAGNVVLANAGAAMRLLDYGSAPLVRSRGQVSGSRAVGWLAGASARLPIAGSGYLLPPLDGTTWFGATSHEDDDDPEIRDADHRVNVERVSGLLAEPPPIDIDALCGRVGFRWSSADRLPLIGAVPLSDIGERLGQGVAAATSPRPDQPRFAPRAPGLFVFAGLGSRGIAGSALGGEVLASCITGAPVPLEADLLDAVDPARFASRAFRRLSVPPGAAR